MTTPPAGLPPAACPRCGAAHKEPFRADGKEYGPWPPEPAVPPQAITATARVHHRLHCPACGLHSGQACDGEPTELDLAAARQLLEAAAPHVAAAERERIRSRAQERLDALGADDFSPEAQLLADILLITGEEVGVDVKTMIEAADKRRRAVAEAVAAERERCAQLVDDLANQHDQMDMPGWAMELRKVAGLLRQEGGTG